MNLRRLRPRFTVRRLMCVVAILAIVLGLGRTYARWQEYRRRALIHEVMASLLESGRGFDCFSDEGDQPGLRPEAVERRRRLIIWHQNLARKYATAMKTPWLTVEPDLSKPE